MRASNWIHASYFGKSTPHSDGRIESTGNQPYVPWLSWHVTLSFARIVFSTMAPLRSTHQHIDPFLAHCFDRNWPSGEQTGMKLDDPLCSATSFCCRHTDEKKKRNRQGKAWITSKPKILGLQGQTNPTQGILTCVVDGIHAHWIIARVCGTTFFVAHAINVGRTFTCRAIHRSCLCIFRAFSKFSCTQEKVS